VLPLALPCTPHILKQAELATKKPLQRSWQGAGLRVTLMKELAAYELPCLVIVIHVETLIVLLFIQAGHDCRNTAPRGADVNKT
jgi:hypothetical protein